MKPKRRLLLIASAVAIVLVGLVFWLSLRHEQLYKVTVFPSLGTTYTRPTAINDRGQVVGLMDINGTPHLFLWDREDGMKDLGPMDAYNCDINNAGQIAGTLTDPNGNKQAFFWDPNDGRKLLGTLGGTDSLAKALNNRGQVVGFAYRDRHRPDAFIWDKTNGMQSLTPAERQYGKARAINDAGHVLGEIGAEIGEFSLYPSWTPCYWHSTDPPARLELSPDGYLGGSAINNNGYVLTTRGSRRKRTYRLCLWRKDAGLKRLFPIELSTHPVFFNDANQVLHSEYHPNPLQRLTRKYFSCYSYRVFYLWDPKRGKVVLNDQVPHRLGKLVLVADINNRGCIVGSILPEGSAQHLEVLLEPIPERWGK